MNAFTLNKGRVSRGIAVTKDGMIEIGEDGRARRLTLVPTPPGSEISERLLMSVPSSVPGALILIKDHSGFRGGWHFTSGPCTGPDTGSWCPQCGCCGTHGWAKAEPPGKVIASGVCAQGAAGRMGGGPEYLLAIPVRTTFLVRRTGRLYGAPSVIEVCVEADSVSVSDYEAKARTQQAADLMASL